MFYYTGDGTLTWPGVPLRDLTKAEWDELPVATQEALKAAGLFSGRKPADEPSTKASKVADTPAHEAPKAVQP